MPDQMSINGQEFEALFLGLNEQDFVKRIFMGDGSLQQPGCVTRDHRQEDDILVFKHAEHNIRIEETLASTRPVPALKFQPHLPDRHRAHIELYRLICENEPLGIR